MLYCVDRLHLDRLEIENDLVRIHYDVGILASDTESRRHAGVRCRFQFFARTSEMNKALSGVPAQARSRFADSSTTPASRRRQYQSMRSIKPGVGRRPC